MEGIFISQDRRDSPHLHIHPLPRLSVSGLDHSWSDKLHDQSFLSERPQSTHEHYLQVFSQLDLRFKTWIWYYYACPW